MSVKQSQNIESGSDDLDGELEEFYSPDVKARVEQFNQHAAEVAAQIDDLISGDARNHRQQRQSLSLVGCEVIENLKRRFVVRMEG